MSDWLMEASVLLGLVSIVLAGVLFALSRRLYANNAPASGSRYSCLQGRLWCRVASS